MAHLPRVTFLTLVAVAIAACGGSGSADGVPVPGDGAAPDAGQASDAQPPDAAGGQEGGRADGGATACAHEVALDPPNSLCETCTAAKCCPAWDACADEGECTLYQSCLFACRENGGDEATCTADCSEQNPSGVALAQALSACWQASCAAECP